jgi:integrase
MSKTRKSKICRRLVESLQPGETIKDAALEGFGVRRQKNARVYFVRKYFQGRRHYITIGEHGRDGWTEHKARQAAFDILAALRQGHVPADERAKSKAMPTLAEFAGEFLHGHGAALKPGTVATYRNVIDVNIRPHAIGSMRVDQVTRAHVIALHRSLKHKPRTANHAVAILGSIFSEARAAGLVDENFFPTRNVRFFPMARRQRFLTESELARLGEALSFADKDGTESVFALAAIRLLILTGCRRDEILKCRWDWVDFERGLLNLPDSKTGAKSVYLNPAAIEILQRLPRVEGNPFVIVGKKDGNALVNLRKAWVRIRERATIAPTVSANGALQEFRLHDLRHSFASSLASGGASLPMIGKLLGHKNPSTTARYAHLSDDPLRKLSDQIGQRAAAILTVSLPAIAEKR